MTLRVCSPFGARGRPYAGGVEAGSDEQLGQAGRLELLEDIDRPSGYLLLIDRVRQSYVDLEDPTFLDFDYVEIFADVLSHLPEGPLAVTHVGGGACTLARWVAVTRPGSPQIVLEPDAEVTELVRSRLPFPRGARIRVRAVDGRTGVAFLKDASADVVVLDAFQGGRVPLELSTAEFVADVARVLRPTGVLLANIADGPPLRYAARVVETVRRALPETLVVADPSVLKRRRFGNLVVVASGGPLAADDIRRAGARAAFPRGVVTSLGAGRVLTAADPMRSPEPPEDTWRVQ